MGKFKVRALEVYDSFNPKRLLEVKFVVNKGNGVHYDISNECEGFSMTGRTFRTSYASLMQFYMPQEKNGENEDEFHIK